MASSGLARLEARLRRIPAKVRSRARAAVEEGADEIAGMQRRLVPKDEGDLHDTIEVERGDHELHRRVAAGSGMVDHALHVEFGTRKMPARPFFFVGARVVKKRVASRIMRAARKAIKEG